jgi:hypothetical protein
MLPKLHQVFYLSVSQNRIVAMQTWHNRVELRRNVDAYQVVAAPLSSAPAAAFLMVYIEPGMPT